MSRVVNIVGRPFIADGTPGLVIRLLLVAAGLAVLALGVFRLPSIATTQGEIVTGIVLSLAVAAQMLVAGLFSPLTARRV